MKTTLLILLELLICGLPAAAASQIEDREDVTVSGVVSSAEDGQPLIGVVVMSSAGGGVSASDDGSYSLTRDSSHISCHQLRNSRIHRTVRLSGRNL